MKCMWMLDPITYKMGTICNKPAAFFTLAGSRDKNNPFYSCSSCLHIKTLARDMYDWFPMTFNSDYELAKAIRELS